MYMKACNKELVQSSQFKVKYPTELPSAPCWFTITYLSVFISYSNSLTRFHLIFIIVYRYFLLNALVSSMKSVTAHWSMISKAVNTVCDTLDDAVGLILPEYRLYCARPRVRARARLCVEREHLPPRTHARGGCCLGSDHRRGAEEEPDGRTDAACRIYRAPSYRGRAEPPGVILLCAPERRAGWRKATRADG